MPSETIVIINADDFGLTEGVNKAIEEAFRAESLTSATLMVNQQATEGAAQVAQRNPALGVGLHFTLTCGAPISGSSAVPSLIDEGGSFLPRRQFEMRAATGRIRSEHVDMELEAQFAQAKHLGVIPTHIDSHQHVHAFPTVFGAVARLAKRERIPLRMPWPWTPKGRSMRIRRRARSSVLYGLLAYNARCWGVSERCNQSLRSIFDLPDRERPMRELHDNLLDSLPKGITEIMVHPAIVGPDHEALVDISDVSGAEHEALTNDSYLRRVVARGGHPASYRGRT